MNRKILAATGAGLVLSATAVLFIAGIWTGDDRWAMTGVVGLFLCTPAVIVAMAVTEQ